MTTRILTILVSALMTTWTAPALAGELDNEAKIVNEQALRGKDLPGTVIVRINAIGEAEVHTHQFWRHLRTRSRKFDVVVVRLVQARLLLRADLLLF